MVAQLKIVGSKRKWKVKKKLRSRKIWSKKFWVQKNVGALNNDYDYILNCYSQKLHYIVQKERIFLIGDSAERRPNTIRLICPQIATFN